MDCAQRVCAQGQGSLPQALVVVTDKGKTAKEQGNLVVKEAVSAMLQAWDAPFRWPPLIRTSSFCMVALCRLCKDVQEGHCCQSSGLPVSARHRRRHEYNSPCGPRWHRWLVDV